MRRLPILATTVVLTLLSVSSIAYGSSPPMWSHTVPGPPAWMHHEAAPSPVGSWTPSSLVSLAGTGVVQGHVYNYTGGAIAGADVTVFIVDDQHNTVWQQETTTDADGLYSVSEAPATDRGRISVVTSDGKVFFATDLAFTDPGTSTYDMRPGRLLWEAFRGGPWGVYWTSATIEVAGLSASGTPVYAQTTQRGLEDNPDISPVAGWTWGLPADARLAAISYYSDEVSLWDMAEPDISNPEGQPIAIASGAQASTVVRWPEYKAYRIFFTNSYWASGKPGTVLKLALQNFKQDMTLEFDGASQAPDGVITTWDDKSYTSTGPEKQTVSLAVPSTAKPGYIFDVNASEPVVRYGTFYLGLTAPFQVCTLNASKTAVHPRAAVRLSGIVPVQGHSGATAGKPKYVWIYKRTTAASAPPKAWDATKKGWTLVGKVRTDGYGRYHKGVAPTRTTWYVARYAGDNWYWGAYTSVLKVRVF